MGPSCWPNDSDYFRQMRQIIAFESPQLLFMDYDHDPYERSKKEDEAVKYTALAEKQCAAGAYAIISLL